MHSMFWLVFVIGALAVVSPGPDFLVVTRNSLLYSRRVGIATALGIVTGNIWWIGASVIGISYIIAKTVIVFNILKWIGALYLIYLGVSALRSKKAPRSINSSHSSDGSADSDHVAGIGRQKCEVMTTKRAFQIGLLTNILNPKCAIFFVSFFSMVITPATPIVLRCAYGFEIMAIAVTWFSLVATVLSVEKIKAGFEKFSVWLDRITGALLVALGVKIALSRN